MNASIAESFSKNLKSVPQSFADCVQWAVLNFEENFSKQENFESDKDPGGQLKRTLLEFDSNDSSHLDFVVIEAVSRAKIYGLPQLDRNQNVELIIQADKKCSAESILPEEIWSLICTNLRVKDLKNVSLVCKRFHEVIADSKEIMKGFKVRLTGKTDPEEFRRIMTSSIRKYQSVWCYDIEFRDFCVWFLDFIRKHPILEMRFFRAIMWKEEFVQICKVVQDTLVDLEINDTTVCGSCANSEDIKTLSDSVEWKKLKSIYFVADYSWSDCLFKVLPKNIESLEYEFLHRIPKSSIDYMNQQTNLKKCSIRYLGRTEDELKNILLQIPRDCLKELTLTTGFLIYEEFFLSINQMKNLEKLTLLHRVHHRMGKPVEICCPTLKSFEFYAATDKFSNDMIEPNLEEFDIRGCVGDKIVDVVSKHNKKLKILKLYTSERSIRFEGVSMPNLMELEINCAHRLSKLKYSKLLESFQNVEKLTTEDDIEQNDFEAILTKATNLKFLEIRDGIYLPGNIFELNEHLLKNLQVLKIYNFRQQTEALKALLAKHPTLRSYIMSSYFFTMGSR